MAILKFKSPINDDVRKFSVQTGDCSSDYLEAFIDFMRACGFNEDLIKRSVSEWLDSRE